MTLKKRDGVWWVDITHNGERVRKSTKTDNKADAQLFHDKLNSELWMASQVLKVPKKEWNAAAVRWLDESAHKRSLNDDKTHLRWVEPFLKTTYLSDITTDMIENIAKKKESTGVLPASVNRMLNVVRAILRRAHEEWGWLSVVPAVRMRKEENHRIRWITYKEAERLLEELPGHLQYMASFTLATGLRQSNVTELKWHVQNGTSLQKLQQLGGWSSFDMVLRYAHLSSEHLRRAAERVQNRIYHQPKMEMNYCGAV